MSVEIKRQELQAIRDQISQIDPSSSAYATLKQQEAALEAEISELKTAAQKQEIEQKQQEHNGGLKELIRGIFESVLPKDATVKLIGLTEYEEIQQSFNQMVEVAVDDSNAALYETVGQQLEAKDEQIRALTTKTIELDSNLQEALNRVESLVEERDELKQICDHRYNVIANNEEHIRELADKLADKNREIEGLKDVIEVKDGEINELRNQLNRAPAPRAGFMDVTPSAKLEEMKEEANKKILSRLEIALSGQTHRGPVLILGADSQPLPLPPLVNGGSDTQESFRHEDPTANDTDREGTAALPAMEVSQFPENEDAGLAEDAAVRTSHGKAPSIEERITMLEQSNLSMQTWIDSIEKRVGKLDGQEQMFSGDEDEAA